MKRLRKHYIKIVSAIILLWLFVLSGFMFSSCLFSPTEVEQWYIESICTDGTGYYAGSEDYYNGVLLSSDYLIFKFEEDGTVYVTDIEGNIQAGTFTEKKAKNSGAYLITVSLDNGKTLTGSCGRYYFDGSWIEFSLSDGESIYTLTDENRFPKANQEGKIFKDIFPEISALTFTDVQSINYEITDENFNYIFNYEDTEEFLSYFQSANFLRKLRRQSGRDYKYSSLTINTETEEYSLQFCFCNGYDEMYFLYDTNYYMLRGELAEFLCGLNISANC